MCLKRREKKRKVAWMSSDDSERVGIRNVQCWPTDQVICKWASADWLQSVACVVSWCGCFRLPFLLSPNPSSPFLYSFFLFCLSSPPTFLTSACSNGCDLVRKIFPCFLWRKRGLKSWLALRGICGHQSHNGAGFSATISGFPCHFSLPLFLMGQARFEVVVSFTWDLWSPKSKWGRFFCNHFGFPLSLLTSPVSYGASPVWSRG